MVSKAMIEVSCWDHEWLPPRNENEVAQAVVNAAWTKFDPDDESTWPDKEQPHRFINWVIMYTSPVDGRERMSDERWSCRFQNWQCGRIVTGYADPQDLKFKEIK